MLKSCFQTCSNLAFRNAKILLSDLLRPCFQKCSDLAFRLDSSKLKFENFPEEHGDDTRAYLSRSKGATAMEGYPFACGCINVCFTLMEVFHPPTQHVGRAKRWTCDPFLGISSRLWGVAQTHSTRWKCASILGAPQAGYESGLVGEKGRAIID